MSGTEDSRESRAEGAVEGGTEGQEQGATSGTRSGDSDTGRLIGSTEAVERSHRAADSYGPPGGAKLSEGFRGREKPSLPCPRAIRLKPSPVR